MIYIDHLGGKEKLNDLELRFLEGTFTPFHESGGRVSFASSENVEAHVQPSKRRKGKILVSSSALESVLNCMLLCSQFHQAKKVKRRILMGKRTHLMERRTERKRGRERASAGRVIAAKSNAGQV